MEGTDTTTAPPVIPLRQGFGGQVASGEKTKARHILAAIRTLQRIEHEHRPATADERQTLARFGGFGAVALSLFPDPISGRYKDAGWETLGKELESLLTPAEYDSAKRTTFNAFYTSPIVIQAIHRAIGRRLIRQVGDLDVDLVAVIRQAVEGMRVAIDVDRPHRGSSLRQGPDVFAPQAPESPSDDRNLTVEAEHLAEHSIAYRFCIQLVMGVQRVAPGDASGMVTYRPAG